MKSHITILFLFVMLEASPQPPKPLPPNYTNPIIHADYSDPDVVRVGEDYYMISSSFNHVPGLPILHSKDLVSWTLIGHALDQLDYAEGFDLVQHGNGVWAPSIRYHNNEFYIYFPDPDHGIYLIKSKNISGPWSKPILVEGGKGLIDPCPLWDDDGKVYLVHAFAGSRAGIKSIIVVKEMNAEGTKTISKGVMVYDGHVVDPTIEGPKFHKRNGYYYIFAPAGGVKTGWQLVLRSKNVYGPYERKVVMHQGSTNINGPHQGAWVETPGGEDWFFHFQDKDAYGRIVHLQPMKWQNDWPVIGTNEDKNGTGEPVLQFKTPSTNSKYLSQGDSPDDEFNDPSPGLQWQWQANPEPSWQFMSQGKLVLFAAQVPANNPNFWSVPSLLMQKFPAMEFYATTKLSFDPRNEGEQCGLIVFGTDYAYVSLVNRPEGSFINFSVCKEADKGKPEAATGGSQFNGKDIFFRVTVTGNGSCRFGYSTDGTKFINIGDEFIAKAGKWVGAKVGLFCTRTNKTNDSGSASFDWFRVEKIQ